MGMGGGAGSMQEPTNLKVTQKFIDDTIAKQQTLTNSYKSNQDILKQLSGSGKSVREIFFPFGATASPRGLKGTDAVDTKAGMLTNQQNKMGFLQMLDSNFGSRARDLSWKEVTDFQNSLTTESEKILGRLQKELPNLMGEKLYTGGYAVHSELAPYAEKYGVQNKNGSFRATGPYNFYAPTFGTGLGEESKYAGTGINVQSLLSYLDNWAEKGKQQQSAEPAGTTDLATVGLPNTSKEQAADRRAGPRSLNADENALGYSISNRKLLGG